MFCRTPTWAVRMTSWRQLDRRAVLAGALALAAPAHAAGAGEKLAAAARAQVGVTNGYDPAYRRLGYPGGDVPRSTGVCADVVVRAARDGLGLDLQRLVHEDMARAFAAYPSRRAWGLAGPDPNIDHRRVLNLEVFWRRAGAELWRAPPDTEGHRFPKRPEVGDILTWRVSPPHVGIITRAGLVPMVTHNIGWGTQQVLLATMWPYRAAGHYRWPDAGA
jgi:uncharacterized protein YijF (DUF1287 family)